MTDDRRQVAESLLALSRATNSPILDEWRIVERTRADLASSVCVIGQVYGNTHFTSGENVITSSIVWYRVHKERVTLITRSGSEYILGRSASAQPLDKHELIRLLNERGCRIDPSDTATQSVRAPRHPDYGEPVVMRDRSKAPTKATDLQRGKL